MQNKNAYVSQKEVPFPAGKVLISKTDTKGAITYVERCVRGNVRLHAAKN